MLHQFPLYLGIIIFIVLLVLLANRVKIAYPIVLVTGGLLLSFIPAMPVISIDPDLIFIIFLPPLLYEAAWNTSWKEFWRWRRVIFSFAFLIVLVTSMVVAWVASSFIPGFSLALGFLLGGIVSPPDAVSAAAIMKYIKVPKRMQSIAEGESLMNDASSLIVFRFALIAVETGHFVFYKAAGSFFLVIFGGVAVGLLIAYIFYWLFKKLPTDANIDLVFTLVAPYIMYTAAESVGVSGVLAVVCGGLFLASKQEVLSSSSRLRNSNVWSALAFVLNGLVFMLIGLELPVIVNNLDGVSLIDAVGYGLLIAGVLIIGRILSTLGSSVFTTFASRFITVAESHPGFKGPLLLGWTGMRGVVSLAAALSIPTVITGTTTPFPQRSLILFITFIVILVTLLLQGLTLPWLVRLLKLKEQDHPDEGKENKEIYHRLARESKRYLQDHYADEITAHPALGQLITRWENTEWFLENEIQHSGYKKIYLDLIRQQREWLYEWNGDITVEETLIRQHLLRLDLEEEKLRLS